MSIETSPGSEVSITRLLTDIVADAQELALQHLALFRSEVLDAVRRTKRALVLVVLGFALLQIGGIFLCLTFAALISRFAPDIPVWGSYAIVAGILLACGIIPLAVGISRIDPSESVRTVTTDFTRELTDG